MSIPEKMRAVQLLAYDGKPESITVTQIPVPRPGPGEVLVKVFASPINPSDLMFIQGLYGFRKPLPAVPGFEGSGTVVESGSGLMARFLKGKRVACAAAEPKITGGMWAEYLVTSAQLCIPLKKRVDFEQAASMLVNPFTAWALMDIAGRGGHKAVVQTAAASALGRMIVRLGQRFSVPVVNVVRRAEQVELLRGMGSQYVVNSSEPGYEEVLRDLCHKLGATIGFDAVAGEMSAIILRAQPPKGRLLVYGGLSLAASQVDPTSLIFEEKHLEGFWLSAWLRSKSLLGQLRVANQVQHLLGSDLKTGIQAKLPLQDAAQALQQYASNMTTGKVLLMP
ncbi:MAG TPA: zinc-binding dehydrogenase [Candidatus Angelobacter sp.]|nr:zinc-binding dehydrogenase [Candidatus Angelobacter sp.]